MIAEPILFSQRQLYFSYNFEVGPLALPSMELYDDYRNFQGVSLTKTVVLVLAR